MDDLRIGSRARYLTLRSTGSVLMAFVVAPFAGLIALWLCLIGYEVWNSHFSPVRDLLLLPWLLMFGGAVCLLVEIVVVIPLLIGFERFRWHWLNGWSAAALGFLLGQLPWLAAIGEIWSKSPRHTSWSEVMLQSVGFGVVGLVAAIVFRLVAVRVEKAE